MKGKSGRLALTVFAIAIAWGIAGCSMFRKQAPQPPPPTPPPSSSPQVPGEPHVITNLDTLTTSNAGAQALTTPPGAVKAVAGDHAPTEVSGALQYAGSIRYVGTYRYPGQERLLNTKAAHFSDFSTRLMGQLFEAIQNLEREDPMDRLQLPAELKPVILVATMNADGQLKEIVLEQHSGVGQVDKMVVAACKQNLYAHNPPAGARTGDGNYKVRLNILIKNYASVGETWTFKTFLGIALL
jgi:hypothetical protein